MVSEMEMTKKSCQTKKEKNEEADEYGHAWS